VRRGFRTGPGRDELALTGDSTPMRVEPGRAAGENAIDQKKKGPGGCACWD